MHTNKSEGGEIMQDLKIVVKEIGGYCDSMKVGDYFIVRGGHLYIPEGYFCYWALQSVLPLLPAKQRKILEPGDWLPNTWEVQCPDPQGRVILKIIPIDPL